MIAPTYYRSLLTAQEQTTYRRIVNCLLQHCDSIAITQPSAATASIQRVVGAVHWDHPELFWVDFWHYQLRRNILVPGTVLHFRMLLDQKASISVANTLNRRSFSLRQKVQMDMSREQVYFLVIHDIASSTKYVDSNSAFWDHTAAGPILNHSAVCEGISKLFLFFCQQLNVPCAMITGTLNGIPHVWNMVEVNNSISYVDVTRLLKTASCYTFYPKALLKTSRMLRNSGYVWADREIMDNRCGNNYERGAVL